MPAANVEIKGLDKLVAKITRLSELRALDRGLRKGAEHVAIKVSKYPPETSANKPNGHWYERGYGPRWRGGTGGKRTSETLGRKWTVARQRMLTWLVGNNVSYGKWVQDEDYQTWFHKRRGWPTTQMVAKLYSDLVTGFVKKEVDLELEK
jgi:hypothetical protein